MSVDSVRQAPNLALEPQMVSKHFTLREMKRLSVEMNERK
jgi:hypothetical protein